LIETRATRTRTFARSESLKTRRWRLSRRSFVTRGGTPTVNVISAGVGSVLPARSVAATEERGTPSRCQPVGDTSPHGFSGASSSEHANVTLFSSALYANVEAAVRTFDLPSGPDVIVVSGAWIGHSRAMTRSHSWSKSWPA